MVVAIADEKNSQFLNRDMERSEVEEDSEDRFKTALSDCMFCPSQTSEAREKQTLQCIF